MFKWKINDIWNYLCIAKAVYRDGMTSLPSSMFSSSYFWFRSGRWQEISDYSIARNEAYLIMKANFESSLIFGLIMAVIIGIASMVGMVIWTKFFGKSLSDKKELLSGHDYVDAKSLKKAIKHKSDITLADISYPKGTESRHTILTGTTGSGKTNVMIELLQQVLDKKERAIVVDTVGTYVNAYFRPDRDVLINPFDYRSLPWSFIKECGSSSVLLQEVAMCLVPDPLKGDNFWQQAARTVFIETVKKVVSQGKGTSDILQMLKKPTSEQQEFLKDTYGANIMNKGADKMAISVNTTLNNATNIFQYLKEGDDYFSIKEWIKSGKGLLFLSCTPAQRAAIIPMITAWLTIASEAIMQIPETKKRTWFFIDELHNLNRLPKIETSLAEIRKFGGCFVIGTQMVSQLNTIYDHEVARTITGLCGTKIVMNVPEPITAQYMSKFLGDKEEVSTSEAISYGANTMRDGVNIAQKNDVKEIVSPSEIMNLKTGEAFVRFADMELIGKVKFKYHELNANI
jgi:type IV conjugative transfer system coupling protein TraD